MRLAQTSGNGKLRFGEFQVFWDKLKQWTVCDMAGARPPGTVREPRAEGILAGPGAVG